MAFKLKAVPLDDSDSDFEADEMVLKRARVIREMSELEQKKKRFSGGIVVSSDSLANHHSTSASLSAAEKKGLKEVEELERELDLKNTFSKETNRRDEDAEMKKYIDEQIKLRREAALKERLKTVDKKPSSSKDSELLDVFNLSAESSDKIDDILLASLSKHVFPASDEKSEAMLSSQMLNGIPEVDLGIDERIRTIEATEEAKLRMVAPRSVKQPKKSSSVPVNYSSNFQQHRNNKDIQDGQLNTFRVERPQASNNDAKIVTEAVVVVGENPSKVEYRLPSYGERPPPRGKASDNYYLSKFKKNNRK